MNGKNKAEDGTNTAESSSDARLKPSVSICEAGGQQRSDVSLHVPSETNHRCNGNIAHPPPPSSTLPLIVEKEPSSCEMKELSPPPPPVKVDTNDKLIIVNNFTDQVKPPVPVRQSTLSSAGQASNMMLGHTTADCDLDTRHHMSGYPAESACYQRYCDVGCVFQT